MTTQPKNLREEAAYYVWGRQNIPDHVHGQGMTPREMRLDAECSEAPEPSVIYADMDANGEFIAVTIVSRSE